MTQHILTNVFIVTSNERGVLGVFYTMMTAKASLELSNRDVGEVSYTGTMDDLPNIEWHVAGKDEPRFCGTIVATTLYSTATPLYYIATPI